MSTLLIGCDFSSSPTAKKPIVIACGQLFKEEIGVGPSQTGRLLLQKIERLSSLDEFGAWLQTEREPWIGGFDLPFGLPRELVQTLGWPTDWLPCIQHYAGLSRDGIRQQFKAFCDARPVGGKFAHRATDLPAGSSPSMKWVNPPVAFMLHAGVPRLIDAGCDFAGLHAGRKDRVALEAYPGHLARQIVGSTSYKSDDKSKQTPERLIARRSIIEALETGMLPTTSGGKKRKPLDITLKLRHAQRDALASDASGDTLDAVLCLWQAAWAASQAPKRGTPGFGLPKGMDPLEGWIVGV